MQYVKFLNRPGKNKLREGMFVPKLGAKLPGYSMDPKNRKPGGYKRAKRYQKLPVKAWKLYWKRNPTHHEDTVAFWKAFYEGRRKSDKISYNIHLNKVARC